MSISQFDLDKSGSIDMSELRLAISSMAPDLSVPRPPVFGCARLLPFVLPFFASLCVCRSMICARRSKGLLGSLKSHSDSDLLSCHGAWIVCAFALSADLVFGVPFFLAGY